MRNAVIQKLFAMISIILIGQIGIPLQGPVYAQTRSAKKKSSKPTSGKRTSSRPRKKVTRPVKTAMVRKVRAPRRNPEMVVSNSSITPKILNNVPDSELALQVTRCESEEVVVCEVYYTSLVTQRLMLQSGRIVAKQKDDQWVDPIPEDKAFAEKLRAKFNLKDLEIYPKPENGPVGSLVLVKDHWTMSEIEELPQVVLDKIGSTFRLTVVPPICPQITDEVSKPTPTPTPSPAQASESGQARG